MARRIRKVAVLGSGIMGSGIACHFANIGIEVLLIDIVPKELSETEKSKGLTLNDKIIRNKIVNTALKNSLASKPSPIYKKEFAKRITTGNFEDDLKYIETCDWIIEAVIERPDIKHLVFTNVEKYRKQGTLVTTNTSGIPIESMLKGRSDDFIKHFCGTHFFNPPRYLKLFEIIPSTKTDSEVIKFLEDYARRFLGKTTVIAKDTPAFIANRIGTFAIMDLFNNAKDIGLNITEIDKLTGTIIGRAKSATFRTADLVGLDTLAHVTNGIKQFTKDEANETFTTPDYIQKMLENKWLGSKTKQGFYKKVVVDGKKKFLTIDFNTFEYKEDEKPRFSAFEKTKGIDDLLKRIKILFDDEARAGMFYRKTFYNLFKYVSFRTGEISDEIYKIDDALNAGFGWKLGPYETWDAVGLKETVAAMTKVGLKPADWVIKMLDKGIDSFYKVENGIKKFYDIASQSYKDIPGRENLISLDILRETNVVYKNDEASIIDIGDGVLNVEFHSKMNVIGEGTLTALNHAIDLAEKEYKAVVISNEADHFSAGANIGMIYMMVAQKDWKQLEYAVSLFQNTIMRMRYSSIPVISAPHGMVLGGGCELSMHCDKVIANAESYIGLVEFGIGVIPGGAGTKEFATRLSDEIKEGDIRTNAFLSRYLSIGQAKVSTSAYEAFDLGYLRRGIDEVIVSKADQLTYAKKAALNMVEKGYSQPAKRNDIKVLGKEVHGLWLVGADTFTVGKYMSEHDKLIAEKLGYVLSGGDISQSLTEVSEDYLLKLEREAFISLCKEPKTIERMQSFITSGKILRN